MYELVFFKNERMVVRELKNPPSQKQITSFSRQGKRIPENMAPGSLQTKFSREWAMITHSKVKEFKIAWHQPTAIVAVKPSNSLPWMYAGRAKCVAAVFCPADDFIAKVKKAIRCTSCDGRGNKYLRINNETKICDCPECINGIILKYAAYFNDM